MSTFRDARVDDLASFVELYADDALGSTREVVSDPLEDAYLEALRQIDGDPRQRLIVVDDDDAELVATLQLPFLPHLVLRGGQRAQIGGCAGARRQARQQPR